VLSMLITLCIRVIGLFWLNIRNLVFLFKITLNYFITFKCDTLSGILIFNRIPGLLLSFSKFPRIPSAQINPSPAAGTESSIIYITRSLFPLSVNMELVDKRLAILQRAGVAGGLPTVV
jgi:hypothetical protein